MKIAAGKVDGFISTLKPDVLGVLVYGPDAGLVSLRAKKIANQIVDNLSDPFRVCDLSAEDISTDPARLSDEINAMSFGGGRRLIKIRDAGTSLAKIFKEIEKYADDRLAENSFILATSGDLKPGGIRTVFETSKLMVALPCYQDDVRGLHQVVVTALRDKNLNVEHGVAEYMASNCQGDRMVALQEVEKLDLYAGEKDQVSLIDTESSIGQTTESNIDDICYALADGNVDVLVNHLQKAYQQGVVTVQILRGLMRYFVRLQMVCDAIQKGCNVESAVSALRPPVFFKAVPYVKRHTIFFARNPKNLVKILSKLYEIEAESRKSGVDEQLLVKQLVMMVGIFINSSRRAA